MMNTTTTRRQPRTLFPGQRRFGLRLAGILEAKRLRTLAVLTTLLLGACQATTPAPTVETVGTLAPSYNSVAVAPVHATTDLSPGVQAVSTDDDAPVSVGSSEAVEAPDLTPKAGLVMGGVR